MNLCTMKNDANDYIINNFFSPLFKKKMHHRSLLQHFALLFLASSLEKFITIKIYNHRI